jgi:hypothetical protein
LIGVSEPVLLDGDAAVVAAVVGDAPPVLAVGDPTLEVVAVAPPPLEPVVGIAPVVAVPTGADLVAVALLSLPPQAASNDANAGTETPMTAPRFRNPRRDTGVVILISPEILDIGST